MAAQPAGQNQFGMASRANALSWKMVKVTMRRPGKSIASARSRRLLVYIPAPKAATQSATNAWNELLSPPGRLAAWSDIAGKHGQEHRERPPPAKPKRPHHHKGDRDPCCQGARFVELQRMGEVIREVNDDEDDSRQPIHERFGRGVTAKEVGGVHAGENSATQVRRTPLGG